MYSNSVIKNSSLDPITPPIKAINPILKKLSAFNFYFSDRFIAIKKAAIIPIPIIAPYPYMLIGPNSNKMGFIVSPFFFA